MQFLRKLHPILAVGSLAVASLSSSQTSSYEIPEELDLEMALGFALEHNFEILKARQRIEEQTGLVIEVRSQALPDVSVMGQYTEIDEGLSDPDAFGPAISAQWSLGVQARQTLYAGGGVRAALRVQGLVEEAALLELQAVVNDTLLAARVGYYAALLARARIGVQEENVGLFEELLENAKNRYEVGSGSRFEVLRAEVSLANARPALIQAQNDYRIAVEELRQTLGFFVMEGVNKRKVPQLLGELRYAPLSFDLESALESALANRPELQRLAKVEEARREGVAIARSGYRPKVALVGSYQFNKPSDSSSFDDALEGWTAGLEVSVPLFDGRRTRGQVLQAKSQFEQARLESSQSTLAVEVEVRRALSEMQAAGELAEASIQVVGQAEEALNLADIRYEAGDATQLDVLQARVSLTEARLNQAEAFYRYNAAVAQVRRSIGLSDPVMAP
ncbi:TolC family protein [Pelagicoccus sp. SDUM812005]|uniref:TolC family protein n=1 Tax=Pelagicoccus sp. SDUM812005 TaxID=3041257 RepID=UPI00280CBC9A|nr:TolC family protein [Pelagicoccus sp. SDUM812005]MDQ8180541.1 TolC family protein [Pelagicoccus sp. SDUM812005]